MKRTQTSWAVIDQCLLDDYPDYWWTVSEGAEYSDEESALESAQDHAKQTGGSFYMMRIHRKLVGQKVRA